VAIEDKRRSQYRQQFLAGLDGPVRRLSRKNRGSKGQLNKKGTPASQLAFLIKGEWVRGSREDGRRTNEKPGGAIPSSPAIGPVQKMYPVVNVGHYGSEVGFNHKVCRRVWGRDGGAMGGQLTHGEGKRGRECGEKMETEAKGGGDLPD